MDNFIFIDISDIKKICEKFTPNFYLCKPPYAQPASPNFEYDCHIHYELLRHLVPKLVEIHIICFYQKITYNGIDCWGDRRYHYYFDFCDDQGNKVLPFDKKQCLLNALVWDGYCELYREDFKEALTKCKTVTVGYFSKERYREILNKTEKITLYQYFPQFTIKYENHYVTKIPPEKNTDPNYENLKKNIIQLIIGLPIEERFSNLEQKIENLNKEIQDLWSPGNIIPYLLEKKFEETRHKLEELEEIKENYKGLDNLDEK